MSDIFLNINMKFNPDECLASLLRAVTPDFVAARSKDDGSINSILDAYKMLIKAGAKPTADVISEAVILHDNELLELCLQSPVDITADIIIHMLKNRDPQHWRLLKEHGYTRIDCFARIGRNICQLLKTERLISVSEQEKEEIIYTLKTLIYDFHLFEDYPETLYHLYDYAHDKELFQFIVNFLDEVIKKARFHEM